MTGRRSLPPFSGGEGSSLLGELTGRPDPSPAQEPPAAPQPPASPRPQEPPPRQLQSWPPAVPSRDSPGARALVTDSAQAGYYSPAAKVKYGVRIPVVLNKRLKDRRAADALAWTRGQLQLPAKPHLSDYIDAALSRLPLLADQTPDPQEAVRLARAWMLRCAGEGTDLRLTVQTGSSVQAGHRAMMELLDSRLDKHEHRVMPAHVASALIAGLLDDLDDEDGRGAGIR